MRHVLLTGAAGGIGQAFARTLSQPGVHLHATDVDADGLARLAAALPGPVTTHTLDVSDARAWEELATRLPAVDLLIHNAGVTVHGPAADQTHDDLDWIVGIDLLGPMHGTRALLPHLRRSRAGHVVFVSSMAALFPVPLQTSYAAAKAGLRQYAASLRIELATDGIGVTTVLPGTIATPFLARARSHDPEGSAWMARQMARVGTSPDTVARAALRAVRRNRAEVRVGLDCHAVAWAMGSAPWLVEGLLGLGWRLTRRSR